MAPSAQPPFPITIVHISDLHFGAEDPDKVEAFQRGLHALEPDLFCVTGDIVDVPWKRNFVKAKAFIESLSRKAPVYVVPGNHDAFMGGLAIRRFKKFLSKPDFAELVPVRGVDLCIFGINSTYPALRHLWNTGYVTPRRLERLRNEVARIRQIGDPRYRNSFKIVLLHHHPLPTISSRFESMLYLKKAGHFLNEMANLDANLILHGHQHDPCDFSINYNVGGEADSIVILSAGSAFKREIEEGISKKCHYYIIRLNGVVGEEGSGGHVTTLDVQGMNYDTGRKRFVYTKGFGKIFPGDPYAACEIHVKYIIKPNGDIRKEETRNLRAKPGLKIDEVLLMIGVDEQTPGVDGLEPCRIQVLRNGTLVDPSLFSIKRDDFREKEIVVRCVPPIGTAYEEISWSAEWPRGWKRLVDDGADELLHSLSRRVERLVIEIVNELKYLDVEIEPVYQGEVNSLREPRVHKFEIRNPRKYTNLALLIRTRRP